MLRKLGLTSALHVEAAALGDRKEIAELAKRSVYTKGYTASRWLQLALPALFEAGRVGITRARGALLHEVITGFCVLEVRPRLKKTRLSWLGVAPEAQGKGIGGSLVRWAQQTSPIPLLELYCHPQNEAALRFYERHGFKRAGSHFAAGEEFVVMQLQW